MTQTPTSSPVADWQLFIDFDGTITARDTDFFVADQVLGPEARARRRALEEAYDRLEISLGEYFRGYVAEVRLPPQRFAEVAVGVPLRPGVRTFFRWCREIGLDTRIVTEGLDIYIAPVLTAAGIEDVEVSCNRLVLGEGQRPTVEPPPDAEPCDRCLNCKGTHVRRAQGKGKRVIMVGDGASDLCAARCADLVLACDRLRGHCRREEIAFREWGDFHDLRSILETVLQRR